ncbi:DUF983 domain-containing protein [Filimonas effusa]|uniref:DUF983 domain-containing protein n=1 Tax=Filimonas effusa TaxID=2508721 RepID=A0A4Q1D367_9BACT|nr:DUF983 domain-containing protein [Filimonas effusa]RXK81739.1 DUF983 domain-containing protein [Filimonas effusa]
MKSKPSYVLSVLRNKCPRCREGDLFLEKNAYALKKSRYIKMHSNCPTCGQPTEIEVGFYYGTSYVSYALGVAVSVAVFVAWWVLLGISIDDNSLIWYLVVNSCLLVGLQPPLMRLSRSIWLSWFVKYDPEWKTHKVDAPERIVKEQMGNW